MASIIGATDNSDLGSTIHISVNSASELKSVLSTYNGQNLTVELAGGSYGAVNVVDWTGGKLSLTSADSSHVASFESLKLVDSHNINLSGLEFAPQLTGSESWAGAGLTVSGGGNITVSNNDFVGGPNSFAESARGMYISRASDISVSDNVFTGLHRGGVFDRVNGLEVIDNSVSNNRAEGFNFAAVTNVEVARNHITDFHPAPGDHPDAIQFWTNKTTTASENIFIHDNVILQGAGEGMQGIFMGNEFSIPYVNVVITNNLVYSNMPRGITLEMANGANVSNNTVLSTPTSDYRVSVSVFDGHDVTIQDNISNGFNLARNSGQTAGENITAYEGDPAVGVGYDLVVANGLAGKDAHIADLLSLIEGKGVSFATLSGVGGDSIAPSSDVSSKSFADFINYSGRIFHGTDGADKINAQESYATVNGGDGNDVIVSRSGDHVLIGGVGNDSLMGGPGADAFVFFGADSAAARNFDRVTNLNFAGGDLLVLRDFSAGTFGKPDGSHLLVAADGSGVAVHSFAELADFAAGSPNVKVYEKGTTGVLVIDVYQNGSVAQTISISGVYDAYAAAAKSGHVSTENFTLSAVLKGVDQVGSDFYGSHSDGSHPVDSTPGSSTDGVIVAPVPVDSSLPTPHPEPVPPVVLDTLDLSSADVVHGTSGNDKLYENTHSITLAGGAGNDVLVGYDGNQTIWGGAGNDAMIGGAGADKFVFLGSDVGTGAVDRIYDLSFKEGDSLEFRDFQAGTFDMPAAKNIYVNATGTGASVHSIEDLILLDAASDHVSIKQKGDTQVLELHITDGAGHDQAILLSYMYDQYLAALHAA